MARLKVVLKETAGNNADTITVFSGRWRRTPKEIRFISDEGSTIHVPYNSIAYWIEEERDA